MRRLRVGEVEGAVDRHRVVDRGDDRPTVSDELEEAAAEALVVVDEVELAVAAGEERGGAREKVLGSPKPPHHIVASSSRSTGAADLRGRGLRKGSAVAVEVERGDLDELDAVVELGVGPAREDGDLVAELRRAPGRGVGCRHPGPRSGDCPGRRGRRCAAGRAPMARPLFAPLCRGIAAASRDLPPAQGKRRPHVWPRPISIAFTSRSATASHR